MLHRHLLGFVAVLGLAGPSLAQQPVRFDSRRMFACTQVKAPEQADVTRKVITVTIPISANFNVAEESVQRIRFELRMPMSTMVLDYLPHTQTAAEILAENVREVRDDVTEVNVEYSGGVNLGFNAFGARFSLGGGRQSQSRDLKQVKTDIQVSRLPTRKQVIVAGTEDEGQTIYFELPAHTQTTRSGQKEYAILLEVAKDWTGDVATLVCAAKNDGQNLATMTKSIGLYLNGDAVARRRVEEHTLNVKPEPVTVDPELITNSIGLKLKRVPAGSFYMGSSLPDRFANKDESPQHRVTITKPFYLGVYEVTQREFEQVMGFNDSHFRNSNQLPVETVTWVDATKFCNKLSERERLKPYYLPEGGPGVLGGNGYRLPSEAEFEYAARAGSNTRFPSGDEPADMVDYAWCFSIAGKTTHPVGQKRPNRFGLYDMIGNVWEMCGDSYSRDYYQSSPSSDPTGPPNGGERVIRGGGWAFGNDLCRFARRDYIRAWDERNDYVGFRVALSR